MSGRRPTIWQPRSWATKRRSAFLPEFELLHASNGEEAYEIIRAGRESNRPVAVAYIDIRMPPGIDGIETIRRVRKIDRDIEIVIMTAYTDRSLPEIVHDTGAAAQAALYQETLRARGDTADHPLPGGEVERRAESGGEAATARHRSSKTGSRAECHGRRHCDARRPRTPGLRHQVYEKLMGLKERELKEAPPRDLKARQEERFREPDLGELKGRFLLDGGHVVETTGAGKVPEQRLFYRFHRAGARRPRGEDRRPRRLPGRVQGDRGRAYEAEVLRLRTELETTYSFSGMVGTSPGMQRVYALTKQAAESDITVLIRGESGTGKELVAKSFHFSGARKEGPFVALDCAGIPPTLIESELFGHERGAFTGATQQRIGAFERADGGTILIDEIGDLPYVLQGKLLRVLQEREIQRIGGTTPISVDIRVITATNKDLERAVKEGLFREDLFYRVAAFPILISAAERAARGRSPARHAFSGEHAERTGKSITGISTATLRLLLQYDWPGNVRELENAIERAVLLETGSVLQAGSLPPQLSPILASATDRPAAVLPLVEVEQQALLRRSKPRGTT